MTVHVSVRSISALLSLSVSLLGLPAGAPAQPVVAPQQTPPTLAERLDRLAAEFDRNRTDLHVPGAVLAIVRGEEVIFARGFGVADIERKTPVTPDTPFFIGSSTKAFTATLVGMLVDEGRMRWDEPVDTYLPEFQLKVQSKDPNDRATLRDVLSTALASAAWRFSKSTEDCRRTRFCAGHRPPKPSHRSGSDSFTTTCTTSRRDRPRASRPARPGTRS